jgi:hypothetical protein
MKFIIPILTVAIAMTLGGCSSMYDEATPVVFDRHMTPITFVKDKDDPLQVIRFARTLSAEGRNLDAARIYEDAANRFRSVDNKFEMDCQKEAVREYWIAGKHSKARKLFDELDADQDIYRRAAEDESLVRLRAMLDSGGR